MDDHQGEGKSTQRRRKRDPHRFYYGGYLFRVSNFRFFFPYIFLLCVVVIIIMSFYLLPCMLTNRKPCFPVDHHHSDASMAASQGEDKRAEREAPRENIFFLKTHKCASSTLQNVLLRYGARHGLTFVLPTLGNYLGNQIPFQRQMALSAPWARLGYNVFCHHTVFQETEVAAVMPPDTVYVTMLRHPATLFPSLYTYAQLHLHYGVSLGRFILEAFRHRPSRWPSAQALFEDRAQGYLGVNQMCYDLGFRSVANLSEVRRLAEEVVDRRFHLVMMAEYFDESMVLLRDLLRWRDPNSVAYFRHNVLVSDTNLPLTTIQREEKEDEEWRRMSQEDRKKAIQKTNAADLVLYNYFLERFRERVALFGHERMEAEVKKLKAINQKWEDFCLRRKKNDDESHRSSESGNRHEQTEAGTTPFIRPIHHQVEPLLLKEGEATTNATCHEMAMTEIEFTNRLKMRQLMKALRLDKQRPGGSNRQKAGVTSPKTMDTNNVVLDAHWWLQQISRDVGFSPIQLQAGGVKKKI